MMHEIEDRAFVGNEILRELLLSLSEGISPLESRSKNDAC